MKKFILILISLCYVLTGYAKEYVVQSVLELSNDISARTNLRTDESNEACALVRFNIPSLEKVSFGEMVVGDVKELPGEYILYLSPETKWLSWTINGKSSSLNFTDYNLAIEEKKVIESFSEKRIIENHQTQNYQFRRITIMLLFY